MPQDQSIQLYNTRQAQNQQFFLDLPDFARLVPFRCHNLRLEVRGREAEPREQRVPRRSLRTRGERLAAWRKSLTVLRSAYPMAYRGKRDCTGGPRCADPLSLSALRQAAGHRHPPRRDADPLSHVQSGHHGAAADAAADANGDGCAAGRRPSLVDGCAACSSTESGVACQWNRRFAGCRASLSSRRLVADASRTTDSSRKCHLLITRGECSSSPS